VVVAAVIALLSTLFAATAAHAGTGSITGKVTKPSGSALSGLTVGAYKLSNGEFTHVKKVTTRSDGTYTLGSLDRGRYAVAFGEDALKYVTEYWNNKPSLGAATTIWVSTSRVSSINARMASGGSIVGKIQREGGAPVPHVQIDIFREEDDYNDDYHYLKTTEGSADGNYVAGGLAPGCYRLLFTPPAEGPGSDLAVEALGEARSVGEWGHICVDPGEVATESADVTLDPAGRVAGRITGPDGEPIAGAWVFGFPGNAAGDVANVAVADADGRYVMNRMSAGPHSLDFYGPLDVPVYPFGDDVAEYSSEWWNDQASSSTADPITVQAGSTVEGTDVQLASDENPVVNVAQPSISGYPEVGDLLKADPGQWSPNGSHLLRWRWYVDGVPTDKTSNTFVPQIEHVGKRISFEVSVNGFGDSAMSEPTAPVTSGGALHNTAMPQLRDGAQVGSNVEIRQGEWSAWNVTRSHQILADGVEVPGATSGSFTIPPNLIGKRLSVRETVTLPNRATTTVTSDEIAPVVPGTIRNTHRPGIYDQPIVGVPLTVTDGSWSLSGYKQVEKFEYAWLADGSPIDGADKATFTPTAAEAGKVLTARVTALREGYTTASSTSVASKPVAEHGALSVQAGAVTIGGQPRIGQTVHAYYGGGWAPGGLTMTYQWLADGAEIDGATKSTFVPTSALTGKKLSVRVTGARTGYMSNATVSDEYVVPRITPFGAPQDLRSTNESVDTIDLAWTEVADAVKYRIYYGIGSGTRTRVEVGDLTTALEGLRADTTYSIDIAAIKADGTRSAYSPRINVSTDVLTTPTDLRVIGQTGTTLSVSWTPVPGVPLYRLYYGIGTGTRTRLETDEDGVIIKGLKPSTTYSIDVASMLPTGQRSSYTPRIDATTGPFLPPTDLESDGTSSSTIDLHWTKVTGATKYRISYGIGDGARSRIDIGNVGYHRLTGLTSGSTYTIDMAAFLPDGTKSPYSPRITVTTD
jgi:hypothetical protein